MKSTNIYQLFLLLTVVWGVFQTTTTEASSHREAPLIANDPLADNTDTYAFRSPDDPNTITLIANFIPAELPHGGPNYYSFGENVRYEIHVDNNIDTPGDDIIYRATFTSVNEDPSTFFNIRLGAENLKKTYTLERSTDGGATFQAIVTNGVVPPPNIGPRSIQTGVGAGASSYEALIQDAITTATTGEKVFCGPVDDPFFVDLGGIFDLGNAPRINCGKPVDGIGCFNTHTVAIQVPISTLQKDGLSADDADNILDGNFVVGVWASASRPQIRTINAGGTETYSGDWVQVSRLGMPLTNEAVIPIGSKDEWNARTPYNENPDHYEFFYNPELALYMDDDLFGGAVPSFAPLRIQTTSLAGLLDGFPGFDFSNGGDGVAALLGSDLLDGTALSPDAFGSLLVLPGKPRSVDLWPIFHTGAPNLPPYQLATGKGGVPVAPGKPFINNFLPNAGDMLRLNMAVPPTPRNTPDFSNLGLVQAAVLGLLDPRFNTNTDIQFIPNMDGFPNGRRLEDDVTRIELQAVAGVVLAAVGLWYDDFDITDPNASPVTADLLGVLGYTTGIETNDAPFRSSFPYMAAPHNGAGPCGGAPYDRTTLPDCDNTCDLAIEFEQTFDGSNGGVTPFSYLSYQLTIVNGTGPYDIEFMRTGFVRRSIRSETVIDIILGYGSSFQLIVTDANGCNTIITSDDVFGAPNTATGGDILSASGVVQAETGFGNYDGSVTLTVNGGSGTYTYQAAGPRGYTSSGPIGASVLELANLASGWYGVTITDAGGVAGTVPSPLIQWYWVPRLARSLPSAGGFIRGKTLEELGNSLHIYPNPVTNIANIDFTSNQAGMVQVELYSIDGKKIANLFNGQVEANALYQVPFNGSGLPAGVYITRLINPEEGVVAFKQLVVTK